MPNLSQEERDGKSPVWDMSQERAFMEDLTNQRVNFFLVIFSIIIGGCLQVETQKLFKIVLGIGSILCFLLLLGAWRSNKKLAIIIKYLKTDDTHPLTIIDDRAMGFSVRWIINCAIPTLCTILICGAFFLSFFCLDIEKLKAKDGEETKKDKAVSKAEFDLLRVEIDKYKSKSEALDKKIKLNQEKYMRCCNINKSIEQPKQKSNCRCLPCDTVR